MQQIPMPEALDCERPHLTLLGNGSYGTVSDIKRLQWAFRDACHYGEALWHQLDEVRRYLTDHVDNSAEWENLFTGVSRVMTGPRGDHGWARSEARMLARDRAAT